MSSTTNELRVLQIPKAIGPSEVSEGLRIAHNCALDELPGLAFGILTAAYVVLALAGLAL